MFNLAFLQSGSAQTQIENLQILCLEQFGVLRILRLFFCNGLSQMGVQRKTKYVNQYLSVSVEHGNSTKAYKESAERHRQHRSSLRSEKIMDSIYGEKNFRYEIIWRYLDSSITSAEKIFPRKHDMIFFDPRQVHA